MIYFVFFAITKTIDGMKIVAKAAAPKAQAAAGYAARLSEYLKSRDPNHRTLRVQSMEFERYKGHIAFIVGIGAVIGSTTYGQIQDPSSVRLPKHDGRSLVL